MKRAPTAAALALTLAFCPGRLDAQGGIGISIAPFLGPTWSGHRYELEGADIRNAQGEPVDVTVGPTTGLQLGLAAEFRAWERVALVFKASWAGLDHVREGISGAAQGQRTISGDQDLVRVSGGVRYRVVPRAPGYFTGGVVLSRFLVGSSPFLEAEQDRTELGGFGGIGLDVGGGDRYLRVEGLLTLTAPGADSLEPVGLPGTFEARSTVLDYSLTVAFVFEL